MKYAYTIIMAMAAGLSSIFAQTIPSVEMVLVEGGTFQMGCTTEQMEYCADDEKPAHSVSISSFSIGKYEITQAQWQQVMGENPSMNAACSACPVEYVSWEEAQVFVQKLSASTGKTYRLPTEAEWEYAARGGNRSQHYVFSAGNNADDAGWHDNNASEKTHIVGQKLPNELGIYDMMGNVWEWCSDWYGAYSEAKAANPTGSKHGEYHTIRGGSWYFDERFCRVSTRDSRSAHLAYHNVGLRLAMSVK